MELYVALKVIWALLLGVLLTGLAVMVGMDMGVGTLLRFVGRTDHERRAMLNAIGPHWDGNQVWFILGGGAIFAAFPTLYATSFSTFYVVMILLLFSMIMRPLAFEYRSKVEAHRWRDTWDWAFLIRVRCRCSFSARRSAMCCRGLASTSPGTASTTRMSRSSGTC